MYKNRTHLDTATEFTAGGVCNQRCGAGPFQAGAGYGSVIFSAGSSFKAKISFFLELDSGLNFFYILVSFILTLNCVLRN